MANTIAYPAERMPYRVIAAWDGGSGRSWDTWTSARLARKVLADLDAEFPNTEDADLRRARGTMTSFLEEDHRRYWADAIAAGITCYKRRNELHSAMGGR